MGKLVCSAIMLSMISTASLAQVSSLQTANPAPKSPQSKWQPDRIICESFETTGTRLGRRKVCKTALEWRDLTAQHRAGVEELQRMGTSVGCQEGQTCVEGHVPH